MRVFPPPHFDAALQRSQQFVRVGIRLLPLKPLEQFSRRPPWLGVEPLTHLRRHGHERIRASAPVFADFLLGLLVGRTSPSCHDVRRPSRNSSSVGALTGAVSPIAGRSAISTSCFWARRISLNSRTGSRVTCKALTRARTVSLVRGSASSR